MGNIVQAGVAGEEGLKIQAHGEGGAAAVGESGK